MTDPTAPGHSDLSFDRAIPISGAAVAGRDATVQCSLCQRPITASYHTVNDAAVCDSCRSTITALTAPVKEPGPLALALLFGFGASLVGAVIYWAVIRFFSLEIGIVAVLNGWMIGKAMRTGAGGRGGRVLQVAAALLTYASVAMAYLPFALGTGGSIGLGSLIPALALPVYVILGSLPGGLISALIIGFGMMQAWQLTGTPAMDIQGPFRVGTAPTV
jgi:hypothetical protein